MDAHAFLKALTTVLCVAALTTVLFHRLRQPVVLGYVLAGVLVGPHVPIPLSATPEIIQTLSELGVILLMFSLGLEFSLKRLARVGPSAALTALSECSFMGWLGFVAGRALGWSPRESVFAGAIIAISSTTIIAKAFDEQGVKGRLREFVVGVLVVEDLIAILLMAGLTAFSAQGSLTAREMAHAAGRLGAFLVGVMALGMLVVPRSIRAIERLQRPETTLVASVGICFGGALLARACGYSVALGAFLAGSLVAESGDGPRVEHLVRPVRDMFAAIFFVSVGMLIDPGQIAQHKGAVALLAAAVIAGKIVSVSVGAFLTGNGMQNSVRAGMSLAQIGEFSFIIAGLGLSLRATGEFLYPVAVAVSALTTLTTPWLIRAAGPVANALDRKLPRPIQTFAALYGSWLERLRGAKDRATLGARVRRLAALLLLDAAALLGLVVGASFLRARWIGDVSRRVGVAEALAPLLVLAVTLTLAAPFVLGLLRLTRRLGAVLGEAALPLPGPGGVDFSAAPRRALSVSLQLAVVLIVGSTLVAFTQPFFKGFVGAGLLAALVASLVIALWRRAADLQGHVRAGAEVVVEAIAAQARKGSHPPSEGADAQLSSLLAGLGEPTAVRLEQASPAVGRSLAALDLRGATGATVLAIVRGDERVLLPDATSVLAGGDVVALAGTHSAIESARALLLGRAAPTRA